MGGLLAPTPKSSSLPNIVYNPQPSEVPLVCKPARKAVTPSNKDDFASIFVELRKILAPYAPGLHTAHDTPDNFYLETKEKVYKGRPIMFGAVRQGKAYVSYHLFPLYMNSKLVGSISPELKRRMQGKTCFNFTSTDAKLFAELEALTREGFEAFREMGAKRSK